MKKNKLEKLLAELDTLDVDDLDDDDFHGTAVNDERWSTYRQITSALLEAMDTNPYILEIESLRMPNPWETDARTTVVMPQLFDLGKEFKSAFAQAAARCDRVTMTAMQSRIRVSFTVDNIWDK